ncbi:hypothetical protein JTB14_019828 [Gonioctena quinquepunctata]|nr:hypothetical protein JTB14_019828 [Gonioctena quinquepunctata]
MILKGLVINLTSSSDCKKNPALKVGHSENTTMEVDSETVCENIHESAKNIEKKNGKGHSDITCEENNTPKKGIQAGKNKELSITPLSANKPSGGKRKKDGTPKVKVGSLVRKKLNTNTPPKNRNNSLLNFLKSSGGKKKNNKSATATSIEIDLTVDEARDAWGKESKTLDVSSEVLRSEEDCTEDFSLQLEDSQEIKKRKIYWV